MNLKRFFGLIPFLHSGLLVVAMANSLSCSEIQESPLDAGIDFASGVHCENVQNNSANCYVGRQHIDCEGEDNPRIYCMETYGCKWVSNGCPFGEYKILMGDDCTAVDPANRTVQNTLFTIAWGDKPWNRAREMNLSFEIDENTSSTGDTIQCSNCDEQCRMMDPCDNPAHTVREFSDAFTVEYVTLTGTSDGWSLVIEADVERGTARACRTWATDALSCRPKEPVCASSGIVYLKEAPTLNNYKSVNGTFGVKFDDGVVLKGSF